MELSSLPGVIEDINRIVLNIKGIGLASSWRRPEAQASRANGPGEVRSRHDRSTARFEIRIPLLSSPLDKGAKGDDGIHGRHGQRLIAGDGQQSPEEAQIGLVRSMRSSDRGDASATRSTTPRRPAHGL